MKRRPVAQGGAGARRIGELIVAKVSESDHAHAGGEKLLKVLARGAQAVGVQHGHESAAPPFGRMIAQVVRRQRQADAFRVHFKGHAPDGGGLGAGLFKRLGVAGLVQGAMRRKYGKGGGVEPAPLHLRQVHRFEAVHARIRFLGRKGQRNVHVGVEGEHAIMERANFRRKLAMRSGDPGEGRPQDQCTAHQVSCAKISATSSGWVSMPPRGVSSSMNCHPGPRAGPTMKSLVMEYSWPTQWI